MSKSPKTVADIKLKHVGSAMLLAGESVTIRGLKADTFGLAVLGTRQADGSSFVKWFRWGDLQTSCVVIP